MRPRTVVSLVVALVVVAFGYWIADTNRAVLGEDLVLWTLPGHQAPVRLPVGQALLACLGLGALAVATIWVVRGTLAAASAVSGWRAARFERETEAAYQRALEALLDGKHDAALTAIGEVLARDPEHGGALMTGADVLRALGRSREAVDWREKRLAAAPTDVGALFALAEDHRARGDLLLAAATYERLLAIRPRAAAAAERLREVLVEAGQYERALVAHDRLARLRAGRTADSTAGETRDDAGSPAIDRAALETRWALQQAEEGRVRDATTLLRRLLKRHPKYVPAWLAVARVALMAEREDDALDAWVDGYERTDEAAILVAAEEHYLESRHDGDEIERAQTALQAFQRFAACSGERPLAVAFLAKLYTRHEMLDEAAAAFDSVRQTFPESATFAYYSARIAEKRGDPARAARLYRGVLKSLDVLGLRFKCGRCKTATDDFVDRCGTCGRWGTVALDTGLPPGAKPAARPVYAVRDENGDRVEQDALA